MGKDDRFQVLHLSDLHISEDRKGEESKAFDRSVVLEPLLARLAKDKKKGFHPEIVAVTGDIAHKGKSREYDHALEFFEALLQSLELPKDRLFLVPGNHDVNRETYMPSFVPSFDSMDKLNNELAKSDFRAAHLKGLDAYFTFVEKHFPHLNTGPGRLYPFVNAYRTAHGKSVGLVGLNSSWMCRSGKLDQGRIAMGEFQIKRAMERLPELGEIDLTLQLFHHPVDFLWKNDRPVCRKYLNGCVSLFGHVHEAQGEYVSDYNGHCHRFQAGGTYLGSESSTPARFQYITFDWEGDTIELDFRMFEKTGRRWVLDGATGNDGNRVFSNAGIRKKTPGKKQGPGDESSLAGASGIFQRGIEETRSHGGGGFRTGPVIPVKPEMPESYAGWLKEQCAYMNIEKLQAKGEAIRLSLPDIFVSLYAYEPVKDPDSESIKGAEDGAAFEIERIKYPDGRHEVGVPDNKRDMGEGRKIVDIESLIGGYDYLLVEGQAGSGKTTLLRHLAYRIADGECIDGLEDCLPVMIFLKDLGKIFEAGEDDAGSGMTVMEILSEFFKKEGNVIAPELIGRFCKEGKVLFLLDGLDEMMPENRDRVVNAFSIFRHKRPGNKIVFSGRPHGLEGAAVNLFGENRVKVLPLDLEQVSSFIRKWFREIYLRSKVIGDRTAESMIAEIRDHEAIDRLIDNPLVLTAICILYHDGKELPNQRAELYKKFVDNMIHRRFSEPRHGVEPEKVREFLKLLAFEMHRKGVRGEGRGFALDLLAGIIPKEEAEAPGIYRARIGELFDYIEPNCGLLKNENGEYNFRHLTFQEFLTALYIVDNNTDYIGAIEQYWDNDRYREVIKLYIGYLSIENKQWANDIISNAVRNGSVYRLVGRFWEKLTGRLDQRSYGRLILAAESLMDIHAGRRVRDVVTETTGRLWEVVERKGKPEQFVGAAETIGWLGDPRDLKEFVEIKGGEYKFGDNMVIIDPFEIGKYPVTNGWYGEFMADGGYDKPEYWSGEGRKWLKHSGAKKPEYWDKRRLKCPSSPVVGVSWYEADAFTRWLSLVRDDGRAYRLHTEIEWEAVAAGFSEKREYPWRGGGWNKTLCNSGQLDVRRTSPVGIFKGGNTPDGISDLAGNVWEWTCSDYKSRRARVDFKFGKQIPEVQEEAVKLLEGASYEKIGE